MAEYEGKFKYARLKKQAAATKSKTTSKAGAASSAPTKSKTHSTAKKPARRPRYQSQRRPSRFAGRALQIQLRIQKLRRLVDGAVGVGPVRFAKLLAIDFACGSFGDLWYELD